MNLVTDPWIDTIGTDGTARTVSLQEAFAEGDRIADLALNPCQRIAVTRLLICIAQAALDGPTDETEWAACRARLRDAALDYLARWQHRFELFGEKAFLQVDALATEPNSLADKLDLTASCGNNPTLLDHAANPDGRIPSPAKLAMDLLVYQVYSPGGTTSVAEWDGQTDDKYSELAPALEGSLLHTIVRGPSLLDTVHANLLYRGQVGPWGKPVWTLDRLLRSTLAENAGTYLGSLVPACRAIRCRPSRPEITLAKAVSSPKLPERREPMATVVRRKRGAEEVAAYVAVDHTQHPWRELGSLLSLGRADAQGGAPALARVREWPGERFDIWTGGLEADKTKLVEMAEWSFSLPLGLLDTPCLEAYEGGVAAARRAEFGLDKSVKSYAQTLKLAPAPADLARTLYWSALDRNWRTLADAAADPDAHLADAWLPCLRDAMLSAYERACPHATPRQIQAYAVGLRTLHREAASLALANTHPSASGDEAATPPANQP